MRSGPLLALEVINCISEISPPKCLGGCASSCRLLLALLRECKQNLTFRPRERCFLFPIQLCKNIGIVLQHIAEERVARFELPSADFDGLAEQRLRLRILLFGDLDASRISQQDHPFRVVWPETGGSQTECFGNHLFCFAKSPQLLIDHNLSAQAIHDKWMVWWQSLIPGSQRQVHPLQSLFWPSLLRIYQC